MGIVSDVVSCLYEIEKKKKIQSMIASLGFKDSDDMFGTPFDGKPFDEEEAKRKMGVETGPKSYITCKSGDDKPGDGKLHWDQMGDGEIQLRFKGEPGLTKKDVAVKFTTTTLSISLQGKVILDKAELAGPIVPDDCTWCIVSGELQIMLTKQVEDHWKSVLATH
eukprot:UN0188